jgi:hypothetical protein
VYFLEKYLKELDRLSEHQISSHPQNLWGWKYRDVNKAKVGVFGDRELSRTLIFVQHLWIILSALMQSVSNWMMVDSAGASMLSKRVMYCTAQDHQEKATPDLSWRLFCQENRSKARQGVRGKAKEFISFFLWRRRVKVTEKLKCACKVWKWSHTHFFSARHPQLSSLLPT